jgi:RNA polymerase-interacting CarD/CdnL/TRCF family regulator
VIARLPESEYKRAALRSARTALNGELAFEQATSNTKANAKLEGLCCKLD